MNIIQKIKTGNWPLFKVLALRLGNKGKSFDTSKEEFLELLKNKETVLLDVRTEEEQTEVPPLREDAVKINFNSKSFEEEIKKLDKNKEYLVNCSSGNRSKGACLAMKKNGFKSLKSLNGGISAIK